MRIWRPYFFYISIRPKWVFMLCAQHDFDVSFFVLLTQVSIQLRTGSPWLPTPGGETLDKRTYSFPLSRKPRELCRRTESLLDTGKALQLPVQLLVRLLVQLLVRFLSRKYSSCRQKDVKVSVLLRLFLQIHRGVSQQQGRSPDRLEENEDDSKSKSAPVCKLETSS